MNICNPFKGNHIQNLSNLQLIFYGFPCCKSMIISKWNIFPIISQVYTLLGRFLMEDKTMLVNGVTFLIDVRFLFPFPLFVRLLVMWLTDFPINFFNGNAITVTFRVIGLIDLNGILIKFVDKISLFFIAWLTSGM